MREPVIALTLLLLLATPEARAQPAPLPAPLTRFADSLTELPRDPSIGSTSLRIQASWSAAETLDSTCP